MDDSEEMIVDIDSSEDENDDDASSEMDASESFNVKKIVIEAILEAMQLIESTRGSIKNFEEIMSYGKKLYCEGLRNKCDQDVVDVVWPNSWAEVQHLLKDYGYCKPIV